MPPTEPQDKDALRYEDMMERLRATSSSSENETRTYDPETGQVRVRKRKRKRGSSRAKREARAKRVRSVSVLSFLGVLVLAMGWFLLNQAHYRSESFLEGVRETVAETLGRPIELDGVVMSGLQLGAESLAMAEDPAGESLLARAEVSGVSGGFFSRSLFGQRWEMDFIHVFEADLFFQALASGGVAQSASSEEELRLGGLFRIPARPEKVTFDHLRVRDLDLFLGSSREAPYRLEAAAMSLRTLADSQRIRLERGILILDGLPEMSLETLVARQTEGSQFEVTEAVLGLPLGGRLSLAGSLDPAASREGLFSLSVEEASLKDFLPRALKSRVAGEFSMAEAKLRVPLDEPAAWSLEGEFSLAKGSLRNLPLVSLVSLATSNDPERLLLLDEVEGRFRWSQESLVLSDLRAVADGTLQFTGAVTLRKDDSVEGALEICVVEKLVARFPRQAAQAFQSQGNGYACAAVTLSGNLGLMQDNLSTERPSRPQPVVPTPSPQRLTPEEEQAQQLELLRRGLLLNE